MEREIKFRAIELISNTWVYGFYYKIELASGKYQFLINDNTGRNEKEIISNTLGEFTGLIDCNGLEIYEGDLVNIIHTEGLSWERQYSSNGIVEFGKNGAFTVRCIKKGCENAKDLSKRYYYLTFNNKRIVNVTGNIHENPELLNG